MKPDIESAGNLGNPVSAQAKITLRGQVFDPTGSVVPNFAVEIFLAGSADSASKPRTQPPLLTVQTSREGEFSADLPPGSYEVCVARFPKSCHTLVVEAAPKTPEYLHLKINPADDFGHSELLDHRLLTIAEPHAKNCGRIGLKGNPIQATKCALRAFKRREAFYVRYDAIGIDSDISSGVAGDSTGSLYFVEFDSMGMDTSRLPPGVTMPDGFHTVVIPCSKPVRLRKTREGKLACFSDGHWLGD